LNILRGLLILLCCGCHSIWAAELQALRVTQSSHKTRLVLELSQPFTYRAFTLSYPDRLVVDLAHTLLRKRLKVVSNRLIYRLRTSRHRVGGLRLVFDLKHRAFANVFKLPATPKHRYRLVIDLATKQAMVKEAMVKQALPSHPQQPKVIIPKRKRSRDVVIVIDPGHGGKDPGAIGAFGTKEKQVVLAIAKRLASIMNKQPGIQAKLTRQRDRYLTLRQRLSLARKHTADIFIAIHADAYIHRRAHGASVFALSERGASSEAARWLAARENHSELGEVSLQNKSQLLRSVLIDLSQTATNMASLQLGAEVIDKLANITDLHNSKVEQAQFVVLKSPDIPSLLVETGFLSNPHEAKRLRSPTYQQSLADAIARGVNAYLWAHAPHGSWLAMQEHAREYEVQAGDSLAVISKRFRVSMLQVKQVNKLSSNIIRIGQVLLIPPALGKI
jgi:N-acetylmuramoyl-L-alanine amidase